jgi:hypothetical protein
MVLVACGQPTENVKWKIPEVKINSKILNCMPF